MKENILVILLTLQLATMVFLIVLQLKVIDYILTIQPKSVTIVSVDKDGAREFIEGGE